MAPPVQKRSSIRRDNSNAIQKFIRKYVNYNYIESLICDPVKLPVVAVAILLAELLVNIFVVENVRYTEIDWRAYMQEVEGVLNGTTNYALLKGESRRSAESNLKIIDFVLGFQATPDHLFILPVSCTSTCCSTG